MPIQGSTFRNRLPPLMQEELDQFAEGLNQFIDVEHNDDGTHKAITTPSVTFPSGSVVTEDETGLVVDSAGPLVIRTVDGGVLAVRATFGANPQDGQTGLEQQFGDAVSMQRLRLHPQSSYDPSANDTSALLDLPSASAPNYSVYRITGAAVNIEGIYSSGFSPDVGQRGQVIVLINNTGGTLSLNALGSVSDEKQIIGGPVYVQDDGAIVLVYDDANEGYQILAVHKSTEGTWQSYTPTWAALGGTQPAIGNGTLTAEYTRIGKTIHYRITMVAGGTTTFGSGGAWTFTLPVTSVSYDGETPLATVGTLDTSASARAPGIATAQSTTTVLPRLGAAGVVITDALPWVWATGDKMSLLGTYQSA